MVWVRRSLYTVALAGTAASAYGTWFHFAIGPSHGAGRELALGAAAVAIVAAVVARSIGPRSVG